MSIDPRREAENKRLGIAETERAARAAMDEVARRTTDHIHETELRLDEARRQREGAGPDA